MQITGRPMNFISPIWILLVVGAVFGSSSTADPIPTVFEYIPASLYVKGQEALGGNHGYLPVGSISDAL